MFSSILALLVLTTLSGDSSRPESICSCLSRVPTDASVSRKVKHEGGSSKAVFSGRVLEMVERKTEGSPENVITFKVIESWKRVRAKTVKIVTPRPNPANCGYDFRVGESYLIYVQIVDDGELWTSICSRTMELAKATEDLQVLGSGKRF